MTQVVLQRRPTFLEIANIPEKKVSLPDRSYTQAIEHPAIAQFVGLTERLADDEARVHKETLFHREVVEISRETGLPYEAVKHIAKESAASSVAASEGPEYFDIGEPGVDAGTQTLPPARTRAAGTQAQAATAQGEAQTDPRPRTRAQGTQIVPMAGRAVEVQTNPEPRRQLANALAQTDRDMATAERSAMEAQAQRLQLELHQMDQRRQVAENMANHLFEAGRRPHVNVAVDARVQNVLHQPVDARTVHLNQAAVLNFAMQHQVPVEQAAEHFARDVEMDDAEDAPMALPAPPAAPTMLEDARRPAARRRRAEGDPPAMGALNLQQLRELAGRYGVFYENDRFRGRGRITRARIMEDIRRAHAAQQAGG